MPLRNHQRRRPSRRCVLHAMGWMGSAMTWKSLISPANIASTCASSFWRSKVGDENIPRCHFGGRGPWFVCSVRTNGQYCGRRVAVLYAAGELFACRRCCGLAYASQLKDLLVRNVSGQGKSGCGSAAAPDLFVPIPARPRGMWRRTYERHCAALAIEGNLLA